jgi:multiple sugar transport system permease protein
MKRTLPLLKGGLTVLVVGFFTIPIAFLISLSFKTKDDVLSGNFLPTEVTLANWPEAFAAARLDTFLTNSLIVAALSGAITLALTLPAAYGVLRLKVGGKWLPDVTLSSFMAPPVVAVLPLFFLLRATGLLNTQIGLALVYGFVNVPVAFWLITPFLRNLPPEIEQAAAIDGASDWQTFRHIVLPMIAPGIVATGLIVTILAYNEFFFASVFTLSDDTRTLPVGVSLFQGDRLVNFGQMAVASLTGIVPVYLIALFLQRYLVQGLAHGAVK